jgi:hypothetical protein
MPGVKIALAAAHFHSFGVALTGQWDTVEKFGFRVRYEEFRDDVSSRAARSIEGLIR